jgi:hypothetical protein
LRGRESGNGSYNAYRRSSRFTILIGISNSPEKDAKMSKENGGPDRSITEALAELFALARELEALSRDDLAGLRMGHLVQIERTRMDFARFKEGLELDVSNLRGSLDQTLAGLIEARRIVASTWEPFLSPTATRTSQISAEGEV